MSLWKKLVLATSTALTLLALAVMTGGGAAALRALGMNSALAGATTAIDAQAGGGGATSPALGPVEVTIGSDWTVSDKLTLTGPVTITCGVFLPSPNNFSFANVAIEQAAGHTVAHAFGSLTPACDGVAHTYLVTATVQDVPFRPNPGTASASAIACGLDPNSLQNLCQSGSAGSVPVTIKK